jgi:hypothetical protein
MHDAVQARVTVEKTPKRAGATPLFRLSAAQKVSWGRSRPARWSRAVSSTAQSD